MIRTTNPKTLGNVARIFFNIFFTAETRSPQRIPFSPFFLRELCVSAVRFFGVAAGLHRVYLCSSVVSLLVAVLLRRGIRGQAFADPLAIQAQDRQPVVHSLGVGLVLPVREQAAGILQGKTPVGRVNLQ